MPFPPRSIFLPGSSQSLCIFPNPNCPNQSSLCHLRYLSTVYRFNKNIRRLYSTPLSAHLQWHGKFFSFLPHSIAPSVISIKGCAVIHIVFLICGSASRTIPDNPKKLGFHLVKIRSRNAISNVCREFLFRF